MKLSDLLASKYNIDRDTIEQCLRMYFSPHYAKLEHQTKVKLIHQFLTIRGYAKTSNNGRNL